MLRTIAVTLLSVASAFFTPSTARAQVAGATTTVGVSSSQSTQIAFGWSVKKALLGKVVYDEVGQRIGSVEDLAVAPDKAVSYVIVAVGGLVGIGRHDVAIPVAQIQDEDGKLVITGATSVAASADAKLFELKLSKAKHWKAYEAWVGAAIVRLHKSIENATG